MKIIFGLTELVFDFISHALIYVGKVLFYDEQVEEVRENRAYNDIKDNRTERISSCEDLIGDDNPVPAGEGFTAIRKDEWDNKDDREDLSYPHDGSLRREDDSEVIHKYNTIHRDKRRHTKVTHMSVRADRSWCNVDTHIINNRALSYAFHHALRDIVRHYSILLHLPSYVQTREGLQDSRGERNFIKSIKTDSHRVEKEVVQKHPERLEHRRASERAIPVEVEEWETKENRFVEEEEDYVMFLEESIRAFY